MDVGRGPVRDGVNVTLPVGMSSANWERQETPLTVHATWLAKGWEGYWEDEMMHVVL
jgi:hypothetical protein